MVCVRDFNGNVLLKIVSLHLFIVRSRNIPMDRYRTRSFFACCEEIVYLPSRDEERFEAANNYASRFANLSSPRQIYIIYHDKPGLASLQRLSNLRISSSSSSSSPSFPIHFQPPRRFTSSSLPLEMNCVHRKLYYLILAGNFWEILIFRNGK